MLTASQVENITKQSLEEYMQKNIWSPIGATSTTFHPETQSNTSVPIFEMGNRLRAGEGARSVGPGQVSLQYPLGDDLGGIGLYSTPEDYAKFLAALISGGGPLL